LRAILDEAGIAYQVNPRLVRGLDYYTKTVFEWVTDRLGSQGTVCAGGRYDGLVEQIGGRPAPAIGFALGLERLTAMLSAGTPPRHHLPHVYLVMVGAQAERRGLPLAEGLRDQVRGLRLLTCGGAGFKAQLKRADKSGARLALILGEEEARQNTIGVKYLREDRPQRTLAQAELPDLLRELVQASALDARETNCDKSVGPDTAL